MDTGVSGSTLVTPQSKVKVTAVLILGHTHTQWNLLASSPVLYYRANGTVCVSDYTWNLGASMSSFVFL